MADAREAPRLIVFSDTARASPAEIVTRFARLAERARPSSILFYLRDYDLPLRTRWQLGVRLAALAEGAQQRFGVADRADWALALGGSALHLPQSGLSARDARRFVGPSLFLSRGSHEPSAVAEPELDALLLSPIFEPRKGRPALGLLALERAPKVPALYALGAVEAHNAAHCLSLGAAGVAVIGAALAADPVPLLGALGILRD